MSIDASFGIVTEESLGGLNTAAMEINAILARGSKEAKAKLKSRTEFKLRKTILVTYVNGFSATKRYAFNVESIDKKVIDAVNIGTIISIRKYTSDMIVVAVLDKQFNFVDRSNGNLKSSINNTNDITLVNIDLDKIKQVSSFVEV